MDSPLEVLKEQLRYSRGKLRDALIMAGVCLAVSYPYFQYQATHIAFPGIDDELSQMQAQFIILSQVLLVFCGALISSMVGLHYSEKLSLPGLGDVRRLRLNLLLLVLGVSSIPLSYYLTDLPLLVSKPELYPTRWDYIISHVLASSVTPEVIFRFGLVTIAVYLLQWRKHQGHPWAASTIVALFIALGSLMSRPNLGIGVGLDLQTMISAFGVLTINIVLAEVYIRYGLLSAMVLHMGVELKYVAYALFI